MGDIRKRGSYPTDMGSALTQASLGLPILSLARGGSSLHACAIMINHYVKCWGYGLYGELGYESTSSKGQIPDDLGENLQYLRLD